MSDLHNLHLVLMKYLLSHIRKSLSLYKRHNNFRKKFKDIKFKGRQFVSCKKFRRAIRNMLYILCFLDVYKRVKNSDEFLNLNSAIKM